MSVTETLQRLAQGHKYDISPNGLVLDIGAGHNPHSRADILAEKYIQSDKERGGPVRRDGRELIQADLSDLPFADNQFDFVFATHVIEHVSNPGEALDELMRVSNRGYIECPSLFLELLHPKRQYHKWLVLEIEDRLAFKKRPENLDTTVFGDLFEHDGLVSSSAFYYAFYKQYEDLFRVQYTWSDEIKYVVEPTGELSDYFEQPYQGERLGELLSDNKKPLPEVLLKVAYKLLT